MGDDRDCAYGFRNRTTWAGARPEAYALVGGVVALALMGAGPASASIQQSVTMPSLVFNEITVVDVEHGKLLPAQRVVITGNRIQAVGNVGAVEVPKGARLINARGKYLIPGLWDMHVHAGGIGNDNEALQSALYRAAYPLFITYGVTGIRDMAQRFPNGADSFRVWQHDVQVGRLVGPRTLGPSADLSFYADRGGQLATPADARRVIDSLKAAGDAFVKYHGTPDDAALYFALVREARQVGLPFVGHVSTSVPAPIASDSGQRSIEHEIGGRCLKSLPKYNFSDFGKPGEPLDPERCAAWAARLVHNGTWLVSTLTFYVYSSSVWTPTIENFIGGPRLVPRIDSVRALWPDDPASKLKATYFRALGTLQQAGVQMLAGSDAAADFTALLGFLLQQELVLLVEAGGLTPLEALRTATLNPAKFLEATDSLGTVAPGKLADLVVLDANPLATIHNIAAIHAVVADGRYYDRPLLDTIRAQAERAWPAGN